MAGEYDDIYRWEHSGEIDEIDVWALFEDGETADPDLTYEALLSGAMFDDWWYEPAGGHIYISYMDGQWGEGTVTLRATDPEGLYSETSFQVFSITMTGYDLEWKDQGNWVPVPSDEGILTDDELRARPHFAPEFSEAYDRISWRHKPWWQAEDDVTGADADEGDWEYLQVTSTYSDGGTGRWYEFQFVTPGDWGLTPVLDLAPRMAAQMLPAEEENVYRLQTPIWEGIQLADGQTNFEEDGNPVEFGGGDRFFAEANLPTGRPDRVLHDQVNLVVSVDRAVKVDLDVRIKLFDPDHYALPPFDIDANETGISLVPDDNVKPTQGGGYARTLGGHFGSTSGEVTKLVTIVATTAAVKEPMTVTARQPTNNFRAAAFDPRWDPADVVFRDDARSIKYDPKPELGIPQSPLLTIWRHLYAELDSMSDPILTQAPNPSIIPSGNVTAIAGKKITIDKPIGGGENRFQGGVITLLDGADVELGTFAVVGNTEGATPEIKLSIDAPASAAKFTALKDDDFEHDVDMWDMFPDLELFPSRFRPACIE
ncbi:MAG TPA: hypothetical protein VMP01_09000, partial [Pirellulaceae bacterium]|nr:hypothetical protein [Pirellulaceae bacterium]